MNPLQTIIAEFREKFRVLVNEDPPISKGPDPRIEEWLLSKLASYGERKKLEGREAERERCRQIAHYWSIEITPEISAQTDMGFEEIGSFRRSCEFIETLIRLGNPAPYEMEARASDSGEIKS